MRKTLTCIAFMLCTLLLTMTALAHSGRTDSRGGHNKRSDGTYHYHSGGDRTIEYSSPPSSRSSPSSATSTPVIEPIYSPTSITATATPTSITITWSPVSNATGYEVSVNGQIKETTDTSVIYSGLTPNQKYSYTVRAKSGNRFSTYSSEKVVATLSAPAPEPVIANDVKSQISTITVRVNGEDVIFDQPPEIVGGRVLVPVRPVVEKIGCAVEWDGITQTVYVMESGVATSQNAVKSEHINVFVNNSLVLFPDQNPINTNGRILIPIRYVVERLGYHVDWDADNRIVDITKN